MAVYRFVVRRWCGFGVGGVRESAVVSVLGEDRWPSVRWSLGLTGDEVGFCTCVMYGVWNRTIFTNFGL